MRKRILGAAVLFSFIVSLTAASNMKEDVKIKEVPAMEGLAAGSIRFAHSFTPESDEKTGIEKKESMIVTSAYDDDLMQEKIRTTKETQMEETAQMIKDDTKPIYVAADENDNCLGYAFCQLREQPFSNNMVPFTSLFIDDLCVDAKTRGQHVGESLFEYVKGEAKRLGCYEVTLNVWAGNTSAEKFYEKMGLKTKERQMEYIL